MILADRINSAEVEASRLRDRWATSRPEYDDYAQIRDAYYAADRAFVVIVNELRDLASWGI